MEEVFPYVGQAIWTGAKISMIPLAVSMAVGLVVSVFQAATQIQEQTLSFVPKLVSVTLVLVLTAAWIRDWLVVFTTDVLGAAAFIAN